MDAFYVENLPPVEREVYILMLKEEQERQNKDKNVDLPDPINITNPINTNGF